MRRFCALVAALLWLVLLQSGCTKPQPQQPAESTTPPMGWNSWNSGVALTEGNIKAVIDAMVGSGMRDAGYRYVNLDAGWAAPVRTPSGELRADPTKFPKGMGDLADYAHAHGMLLGLYASPFNEGCSAQPALAALGHENQDAKDYASWGVDFLKYDWCRNEADHQHQVQVFTAMRDALRASGRHIVYSINPNSSDDLTAGARFDWSGIADSARATTDLVPFWRYQLPGLGPQDPFAWRSYLGVPEEFDNTSRAMARSKPGYSVDADMLVAGVGWGQWVSYHVSSVRKQLTHGAPEAQVKQITSMSDDQLVHVLSVQPDLTADEQRTHLSLWAMLSAPLLAGNDVRTMSAQTRDILTNRDVIAIDQDSMAAPLHPLPAEPRVLIKSLSDGAVAVALFNAAGQPAVIGTTAGDIGLPHSACYAVRDLWSHTDSTTTGSIGGNSVAPHAVALLRITANCP